MSKEKSDKVTIICSSCSTKETRSRGQRFDKFYKCTHFKGDAGLYRDTGHYPLCRECVREMASNNGQVDVNKFKKILKSFNRPFIRRLYERALLSKKDTIGQYFTFLGNRKYQPMTWKDSDELNDEKPSKIDKLKDEMEIIDEAMEKEENNKITNLVENVDLDKLKEKYGYGYEDEEYILFEKKWKKLIDNYGEKTSFHTENLITYIRFRVKEEMATANGNVKEAKEWGALADKAADNAKINVKQLSKSDISGGVDLICQIFEAVETEVGIIPLLPKLLEQPYDDADIIIWSLINYGRRLEGKPMAQYRDIWNFYDKMLSEYFTQQGFSDKQIEEFKKRRENVFRDLSEIYKEPLYEET